METPDDTSIGPRLLPAPDFRAAEGTAGATTTNGENPHASKALEHDQEKNGGRFSDKTTAPPRKTKAQPLQFEAIALWRNTLAQLSITVVIFCWRILLISESMDHHDSEIMDDRSID